MFLRLYDKLVLSHPIIVLLSVSLLTAFFFNFTSDFELDVSPDSLVLEKDQDLKYYRKIKADYGSDDYLILTYSPKRALFSDETITDLTELEAELLKIKEVSSVVSILNVPLLQSPELSVKELQEETLNFFSEKTDVELAKKELIESPLYKNRLTSPDGSTTALQINFRQDRVYEKLRDQRDQLIDKRFEQGLTREENLELVKREKDFDLYDSQLLAKRSQSIEKIRTLMSGHRDKTELHLGGIPMIVSDMIDFIGHDLRVFSVGVLSLMCLILYAIFRKLRWVILPVITSIIVCIIVVGVLGFFSWKVTVVSSNFLSLLLIFTFSLIIHLIVRYQECSELKLSANQRELVLDLVKHKTVPCVYTILTTIVAFCSLVVSNIRPVINFGWIMVLGLVVSFICAFTFFPASLMLLSRVESCNAINFTKKITAFFSSIARRNGNCVLIVSMITVLVSSYGIAILSVENRFIDYFRKSTEIYQGMSLIDEKLGGTNPLDVVIDAPRSFFEQKQNEDEDDWAEEFGEEEYRSVTTTSYWFNSAMLETVSDIHNYLESIEQTGKVLSLATGLKVLEEIKGESLDTLELGILLQKLPKETYDNLIKPYMSEDGNQLRFTLRVRESDFLLKRQELLNNIQQELIDRFGLKNEQIHLTGMVVLYNNMLQSLYKSQILTLGAVFVTIMIVFAVLFRSLKLAAIAIVPNIFSAVLVLGLMGLIGIPLNIMTITVAAITVGIAVDDTIHYVHRFGEEIVKDYDYKAAIQRSHNSIGRAMYYTSLCITMGFLILVISDFVPTIHFGVLTALAMVTALLADMTILPVLLEKFKPYGTSKEGTI